jgi:K+-transporting ATPase KdpF subunit
MRKAEVTAMDVTTAVVVVLTVLLLVYLFATLLRPEKF